MAEDKRKKVLKNKKTVSTKTAVNSHNKQQEPGLAIEKLFLKDVSVEVPNAPEIFTSRETPQVSVELNNNAKALPDGYFEVSLQVSITSKVGEKTAFLVDVTQSGIFALRGFPEENLEPVLAIACPGILFPYAREAISDLITKSGFTAVLLNPINCESLYMQQKQQQADASKNA